MTTLAELLASATERISVAPSDGKSGAKFEKLTIDGDQYFLKTLSYETDWIMRCTGNTDHWEHKAWEAGLYERCPPEIDHAMVAMELDGGRLSMLMRDVSSSLVPEGDAPVTFDEHDAFIDHMAAFHAAYWDWTDNVGLCPLERRVDFFSDECVAREMQSADPPAPIRVAQDGWRQMPERAPRLWRILQEARRDPSPLAERLRATPQTFIAGDWKMGNLGYHGDTEQTVLLDWAYPGEAPGSYELMWYLALNRSRLPRTKEQTIDAYRFGLERRGISTDGWWEDQLHYAAVLAMCVLGWEKAVGDSGELEWWEERITKGDAERSRR